MLGIIGCKVMGAREVLFGTHIAVSYTHLPKKSAAPKPAEDAPKAASAETEEE